MKKRGFTLVELLTVIAILAIILLIASPIILNVLEKAKQNTFKNQALLYVEGLKQQAVLSSIGEGDIVLPINGKSVDIDVTTINLEIDKNYTGSIRITNNNGKYEYTLINVTGDGYQANGPADKIVVTKTGKTTSTPAPTYTAYTIGQQVTLKDNSVWYVIEDSNSSKDTVTLFASQNIKNDASGWTTVVDEYKIAFDEANARSTENNSYCIDPTNGCNIYAAQNGIVTNGDISGTVTEDSTIKKFLDGRVTTYINNSLTINGGNAIKAIRLITVDEICNIVNGFNPNNNCTLQSATWGNNGNKSLNDVFTNLPTWLYSTSYWTMTPLESQFYDIYYVNYVGNFHTYIANRVENEGARPVIVTPKSNIK